MCLNASMYKSLSLPLEVSLSRAPKESDRIQTPQAKWCCEAAREQAGAPAQIHQHVHARARGAAPHGGRRNRAPTRPLRSKERSGSHRTEFAWVILHATGTVIAYPRTEQKIHAHRSCRLPRV